VNDDDDNDDDETSQYGVVVYMAFAVYMLLRTMVIAVDDENIAEDRALEKFTFIWSTSSASLVEHIAPSIEKQLLSLLETWELSNMLDVLDIKIHCTDPDHEAVGRLVKSLEGTTLEAMGVMQFKRPDFYEAMKSHERRICLFDLLSGVSVRSDTLVGYCGHPYVGKKVLEATEKMRMENATRLPDKSHHRFYFEQESFGQVAKNAHRRVPRRRPIPGLPPPPPDAGRPRPLARCPQPGVPAHAQGLRI